MRSSRFINVDNNVLIEYLYDDGDLISEPYNILINDKTNIRSFISTDDSDTNNDLYSTLYKIDPTSNRYSSIKFDPLVPNKIDNSLGFLQVKNFPSSIPIRYDTIKVHIPIDWVFDDYKGFHIRVYTFNFDESSQVDLSNYYFDITDVDHNYKMEYASPVNIINEKQWGKFLEIKFPSPTKVSDQRKDNVTKNNTINFNLTDGLGISKNAPVFIDFHYLNGSYISNDIKFYNLSPRVTMSFPQTPEFENMGVVIEKSNQGDFFLVYGTYNGSLGELNQFLNESYYTGNRYYLEYEINLYEKGTKVNSQTYIVNEEFNKPIEYRPILKFSTTTAAIDVTLSLVDSVSGSKMTRKSSIGIIQEDVSKYSKSLSRIDIKKAIKKEVYNIKSIIQSNASNDDFGTKPILVLEKLPFNLFSSEFNISTESNSVLFENKTWLGLNKTLVPIFPFDNILKFSIIEKSGDSQYPYDLTTIQNLKFTIKSDEKELNFDVYKDSDENQPEIGSVVFRVPLSKYKEIKKANLDGINSFYINGIDQYENRIIIYNGYFMTYDSPSNYRKMNSEFKDSQLIKKDSVFTKYTSKDVRKIDIRDIKQKGVSRSNPLLSKPIHSSLSKVGSLQIKDMTLRKSNSILQPILLWVLKKKSLSTLMGNDLKWIDNSSAIVSFDLYVKLDGSTTETKPTKETISQYKTLMSKNEESVKNEVFNTISNINISNWKKSEWPYFENIIYNMSSPIQIKSFNERILGGSYGEYESIDDSNRVYYAEEIIL